MNPRPLLQLEGAAVLIVSLFFYHWCQEAEATSALRFGLASPGEETVGAWLIRCLTSRNVDGGVFLGSIQWNAASIWFGFC